jgi:hypothetical protein
MKKVLNKKTVSKKKKRYLTNTEIFKVLMSIRQPTGLKDAVKFIHQNR